MDRKYECLLLERQLCFPLYACARETIKLYTPHLGRLDLTYTQYIAMLVLWERHSVSVKELGEALYLDSGTLTPLLKKMEAKGLLTRRRSAEDERSLIVTLTEKGLALRERAVEVPSQMARCVNLEPEECQELCRLLNKLLKER
jgi:DNA-binding MarR family transcriptional regulator